MALLILAARMEKVLPLSSCRRQSTYSNDSCAQAECTDGANPAFDLLLDTAGTLFGVTTDDGGGSNPGVVFKLSPSPGPTWKETVLHTFCSAQD